MRNVSRVVSVLVISLCAALTACGPDAESLRSPDGLPTAPSRDTRASENDAPAGTPATLEERESDAPLSEEAPAPPPEAPTTFRGRLARTETVRFGGSPYCEYDVTLEEVDLVIDVLPSGEVTRATLANAMVERPAASCPFEGKPRKQMSFTLARSTAIDAGSTSIELSGAATNSPKTRLVVVLERTSNEPRATATWKRTDVPSPLDWEVEAAITLARE